MKDIVFGIAMLIAGIFCAVVGLEHELMFYVGGFFAAIGIVVVLVAEFGGGLVHNPDDEFNQIRPPRRAAFLRVDGAIFKWYT